MTRVAIVSALPVVRAAVQSIVRRGPSLVLTVASSSVDALSADPAFASSEVVLLHAGSTDLVRRTLDALPPIPVVVLLGGDAPPGAISALLAAGVRGVLPEASTADEITAAVEAAAAGLVTVPSELVRDLVAPLRSSAGSREFAIPRPSRSRRAPALTPREQEILAMLAEGLPNKAIASRLGISDHTVKTHLEAMFEKLGASTRAQAVARAVSAGMLLL